MIITQGYGWEAMESGGVDEVSVENDNIEITVESDNAEIDISDNDILVEVEDGNN